MTGRTVWVNLNVNGIASPAVTAAVVCKEIVDLYFAALDKLDLSETPKDQSEAKFSKIGFTGHNFTAEQRRSVHQNWILAKAFQDIVRGVRGSLEEAYLVIGLITAGMTPVKSDSTLQQIVQPFRDAAGRMNFPTLLNSVNSHLEQPLEFSDAYRSMQAARNCLEHRNGIVGPADAGEDDKMILQFPRLKFFVNRDGQEVELHSGLQVNEGEYILFKMELRRRAFALGQPLQISAGDFDEIALACSQFGHGLAKSISDKFAAARMGPSGTSIPK